MLNVLVVQSVDDLTLLRSDVMQHVIYV